MRKREQMIKPGGYTGLGYRSAQQARKMGLSYQMGTEDYQQRWDRDTIINQSRAFFRDNFLYESLINRFADMVLGPNGFTLQAKTSNKRINELIENELWPEFEVYPEVRHLYNWQDVQRMVLTECVQTGDVGAIKVRSLGELQLIEAERITAGETNANVEQGVELNSYGKPVAYWVGSYDANGISVVKPARFNVNDFLYIHAPFKRPSQTRAMPVLQSAFAQLHRINDIIDAEAIAWQVLSRFSIAITKRDAENLANQWSEADADVDDSTKTIPDRVVEMQAGTIFWGEQGEEIKGIEQNRPPEHLEQSIKTYLRLLSMPLGIPLEIWMIDWGGMNLSSARASLLQFYANTAQLWQQLLIRSFHSRVYRWKVGSWIAAGIIPETPDAFEHEFIAPEYPWIDPEAEANAWAKKMDRNLSTYSEALKSQNKDRGEMLDVREAEVREAIERAEKIEKDTGEDVPWQIFAGLEIGKTESAARIVDAESGKDVTPGEDDNA